MAKKVFTDESLQTFVDEIKGYTDNAIEDVITIEGGGTTIISEVFGSAPYTIEFTEEDEGSGGVGVTKVFVAGTSAPSNTSIFWVDTNTGNGVLKYHNGTSWVALSATWS